MIALDHRLVLEDFRFNFLLGDSHEVKLARIDGGQDWISYNILNKECLVPYVVSKHRVVGAE